MVNVKHVNRNKDTLWMLSIKSVYPFAVIGYNQIQNNVMMEIYKMEMDVIQNVNQNKDL